MSEADTKRKISQETSGCVWCLEPITGDPTIIGPTERFPDSTAHTWPFHDECAAEWAKCLQRLERLSRAGGRHTLVDYPIQNGVPEVGDF